MAKVQRLCVDGEPVGVCVGFSIPDSSLADMGANGDDWEMTADDGSGGAWQQPDGSVEIQEGGEDLAVWRTREAADGALATIRAAALTVKLGGFLDEHTADFITKGVPCAEAYSLEEMMAIVQGRAIDADDKDCEQFLNEEVPWEDVTVPDPRGWCNH